MISVLDNQTVICDKYYARSVNQATGRTVRAKGEIGVNYKISEAEMAIMQILWANGEIRATEVANIAKKKYGWEKNTGYTFLHRLIKKGAVLRRDPGFHCTAACERDAMLAREARYMVDRMYDGSIRQFVSAFFGGKTISAEEKEQLKKLIDGAK